eukprot:7153782-Alexandrium_andersonii.AAC.1
MENLRWQGSEGCEAWGREHGEGRRESMAARGRKQKSAEAGATGERGEREGNGEHGCLTRCQSPQDLSWYREGVAVGAREKCKRGQST